MRAHIEIENIILSKLKELLGKDLKRAERIWESFPQNRSRLKEAPQVSQFVGFIEDQFEVFLSEKEWENLTVSSLARLILAKRESPQKMLKDYERELRLKRQGVYYVVALGLTLTLGAFFLSEGDISRGLLVAGTIGLLLFLIFWGLFSVEQRRQKRERDLYPNRRINF